MSIFSSLPSSSSHLHCQYVDRWQSTGLGKDQPVQRRLSGGWQGGFIVSGAQHEDHGGGGGGDDDLEELDAGAEFCPFHI